MKDQGEPSLEDALQAYVAAGRAAWPNLAVDDGTLVAYLAERSPHGQLPPLAHAADMRLACACALRVPQAVDAFQHEFAGTITRVLVRRGASTDSMLDAIQKLNERLFVAARGAVAKIAEYKGTGPLRSWVSTTAATTLLMMQRTTARRREVPEESMLVDELLETAPELRYLQERYKGEVEASIVQAVARLEPKQRALLRLQLGEGMSIDQLRTMYNVNRATAARWLAAARKAVLDGARNELRKRFGLSESECDSLIALVQSKLHVSLLRHLE